MTDVVSVKETTTVVITGEKTVDIITVGIQGPPGPGLANTDALPEGGDNLYYTEERVAANPEVAANTGARHTHANKPLLEHWSGQPPRGVPGADP